MKQHVRHKDSFVSLLPHKAALALLVFILVLAGLYYLFPRSFYLDYFKNPSPVSDTSLTYLTNLVKDNPDNIALQTRQIEELIALGKLSEANDVLADFKKKPSALSENAMIDWLSYSIAREHFFELKKTNKAYETKRIGLSNAIRQLIIYKIEQKKLMILVKDALAINEPSLALAVYDRLFKLYPYQDADVITNAAQVALSVGDYAKSADYYFRSKNLAMSGIDRRQYFLEGIKALESSGDSHAAFNQAMQEMKNVSLDNALKVYLTELSLRANQATEAQDLIYDVIFPKDNNTKSESNA